MVSGIKWVDEVMEGVKYVKKIEKMDNYKCEFCVNGDEIKMKDDGIENYNIVKDEGS